MGGTGESGGERGSWGECRDGEKASSSSALPLPHHLKPSKVLFSSLSTMFPPLWLNWELLGAGRGGQCGGVELVMVFSAVFPKFCPSLGPFYGCVN